MKPREERLRRKDILKLKFKCMRILQKGGEKGRKEGKGEGTREGGREGRKT